VPEAHDGQLRIDRKVEVVGHADAFGEVRGQIDVALDQAAQSARAEVLPAHPELQRAEAPVPSIEYSYQFNGASSAGSDVCRATG
jgi:hypothetical protein